MEQKHWIVLIELENDYYVMANKDKSIASEPDEKKMLNHFTVGYYLAKHRGIQGTTVANLHSLTFNPSIINLSLSEMEEELFNLKKGVEFKVHKYTFGSMPLLKCNSGQDISKIFNKGFKPNFSLSSI